MKKKLIHTAVLTALLSASSIALAGGPDIIPEPDYFSGFYIGGIGGVHHNTINGSSSVTLSQDVVSPFIFPPITFLEAGTLNTTDVSGGEYDGYGGLQGGFGKVLNHMYYVGVQGWGEWGSSNETDSATAVAPLVPFPIFFPVEPPNNFIIVDPSASATTSTTVRIGNDYGVAAKLGWVVAPRSMIYGKIGASWADIKVSNSASATSNVNIITPAGTTIFSGNTTLSASSSNEDDNQIGLLLGVGFEQFVYQDIVSLNVEADYTNYGSVSTGPAQFNRSTVLAFPTLPIGPFTFTNGTNLFSSASSNAQVSTLMAGLNFYFGRDWL